MTFELEETKISEVCEVFDGPHATPKKTQDGPIFLGITSLSKGRIDLSGVDHLSEEDFSTWTRRVTPRAGDVVFSYETKLGEAALVPQGLRCCLGRRMALMRPNPTRVDSRFLLYYYLGPEFQELIRERTIHGSTVDRLSLSEFPSFPLRLPPLADQKSIAEILGNLDDKIELDLKMNATLEAMARAFFQSWFVDFDPVRRNVGGATLSPEDSLFPDSFEESELGLVPKGWLNTTFGQELDFSTGFAFKSASFSSPGDIRLARGDNVKEGFFHWDSKTRYWPEVTPELERYRLKLGDVLIGMDGSKVGKNWVRVRTCDLPCLLVQRVACLRPSKSIGQHFIWLTVSDPKFRAYVDAVKTGTSIPHISGGQIKAYDFVRPPAGDNRIFEKFEQIVGPLGEQIDANIQQIRTLETLRDTLLPQLLSGELAIEEDNLTQISRK
jgi:type I restriction enzyme S subunit